MSADPTAPDTCPVDGCPNDPESIDSLRSHVNAKADHPPWADVRDRLTQPDESDEQAEAGDDQPAEAGESPDDSDDGDQAEAGDDQPDDPQEAVETAASEGEPMPGDDDYQQQYQGTEAGESPDDSDDNEQAGAGDDQGDEQAEAGESGPLGALPMDPVTLGMLLAVAVGLWLTYRALTDDEAPEEPPAEADDGEEWGADSTEEMDGGLS